MSKITAICVLSIDIETQNLKVRSITETVLENQTKKDWKKNFLEPDAFSDKQYCGNWRAGNFFAVRVRMPFFYWRG